MKKITLLCVSLLVFSISLVWAQTVTDIDNNEYQTVAVGDQEWMVENLRVTKYRNGDEILTNQSFTQWQNSIEGIWTNYDNNPANDALYGKLYNWYATIDERGLCPTGWRVPTDDDWQKLVFFIDANAWGNNNSAGSKLKSRRQENSPLGGEFSTNIHPRWDSHDNRFGTDDYNFSVLPAGAYLPGNSYANIGKWAYFWSTTQGDSESVWVRTLLHSHRGASRSLYPKEVGLSVRCVKGEAVEMQIPQLITKIPADVTLASAILGGVISLDGGAQVSERGVVWGTTENPTLENNEGIVISGSGIGEFAEQVEGLSSEYVYWIRAFATNSAGTAYGVQKRLELPSSITLPTITTLPVQSITHSSAQSGGTITSIGGALISARGLVWSTTPNPTLDLNNGYTTDGQGSGTFSSAMLGLESEKLYYVRSYATNSEGTAYGEELNFETKLASQHYTLSLSINPDGWGTVTGAGDYEASAEVDLVATPEAGYQFVNWTLGADVLSTSASYTYTMPEGDVALVANFEEIPATLYELSITASPVGYGTASGAGNYAAGAEVSLTATAASGYQFVNWTLGADVLSTSASYTYTMPEGDVALVANFEEIPATLYELSVTASPTGYGTASGAGNYAAGAEVSLTATAASGYQFVNWTLGADVLSTSASYTYTMPEGDIALVANFQEQSSVEDGDPCPDSPTVTDYDDNVYNTVYIGGQCWIRENLKTTHYSNGDPIVKDAGWASATTGVYGVYSFASIAGLNSEQEVLDAYGALYNWYAVEDGRGLCPVGWRVATLSDWEALSIYIESIDADQLGNQLKSCRQDGHPDGGDCDTSEHPRWNFNASNSGNDRYNFGGLPAGFRDQSGNFQQVGAVELWWTGTSYDEGAARYIEIKVNGSDMVSTFRNAKNNGSSVRCIKE